MIFFGKRGMETWQLVLLVLALLFLFVMLLWYGGLGEQIGSIFNRLRYVF